ncbi:hypothetical protein [Streptomyces sp. NPDC094032]|uniref:hypothetical protein n=1 Tax=Streptomyces sp. NPDC094032 TaxID=3155308 RepID=UPI0033324533
MRRIFRISAALLAASLVLTACGYEEERRPRVTAEEQCDGTVSAAAAPALRRALATERFSDVPAGWLAGAAAQLKADYPYRRSSVGVPTYCAASAEKGRNTLKVDFDLYDEQALGGGHLSDPFMYPYDLGVEAYAGYRRVYLYVKCVSPQLKGSQQDPARIRGTLQVVRSTTPDTTGTREDNLVVLHSVMLATVRELGCVRDAGLPSKPVFKAKKPSRVWPQGPI